MPEYPFVTADVFTDTPLEGNQLAVFTDGAGVAPELMQKLAREVNYAETVFVLPPENDGDARIRIFTPSRELPFAGHPVLGSAFVLGEPLRQDVMRLGDHDGVGANCFTGSGRSWRLRMFGPALGVDEDAASGSAAGPLAVHLARHGWIDFGDEIEIRQGESVGRPSRLYARADGSPARIEGVEVGGSAVIVAAGTFRLP